MEWHGTTTGLDSLAMDFLYWMSWITLSTSSQQSIHHPPSPLSEPDTGRGRQRALSAKSCATLATRPRWWPAGCRCRRAAGTCGLARRLPRATSSAGRMAQRRPVCPRRGRPRLRPLVPAQALAVSVTGDRRIGRAEGGRRPGRCASPRGSWPLPGRCCAVERLAGDLALSRGVEGTRRPGRRLHCTCPRPWPLGPSHSNTTGGQRAKARESTRPGSVHWWSTTRDSVLHETERW
jgi:hypothetical protein